jgi:hypothetical protein
MSKTITCYACSGGHVHIILKIDGHEHEISLDPESALEFSEDLADCVEELIDDALDAGDGDSSAEPVEKKVTVQ